MGSKSKLAEWIISYLPKAEHFYDLCAGGCSVSHCAMLSNKFGHIHINDVNPYMPQAFIDAIHGKFKDEKRWISHDDFFRLRRSGDTYVDICFSFGNRYGNTYAYSRELEPYKKAAHHAVVMGDYSLAKDVFGIDVSEIGCIEDLRSRYMTFKRIVRAKMPQMANLENIERLYRIQSLERLFQIDNIHTLQRVYVDTNVHVTNLSYDEVEILPDSVIYVDPPYANTHGYYKADFDHERFYGWLERQECPVYVSEYFMPEDRFVCVAERKRNCTMDAYRNDVFVTERIYVPMHQYNSCKQLTLFEHDDNTNV